MRKKNKSVSPLRSEINKSVSPLRSEIKVYQYTVIFEPAEEGGYTVTCPALKGFVTEGDTLKEAREMAKDAIQGYLESLAKDGEPVPVEKIHEPVKEVIEVSLAY